ncbi:MAG: hypothetical protein C4340_05905, partial [Armatimonadota bacterium]
MQVQRIGYRIKGFYSTADRALCWSMISADAQERYRILCFWEKHGLLATREAFGVSRRTLYAWRQRLRAGGGKPAACAPLSTRPHHLRQRRWPPALLAELRRLRTQHKNLGKEKLHPFLAAWCRRQGLGCPSVRTIGRLIAAAPDKMRHAPRRVSRFPQGRLGRRPRTRKPKGYRPACPGDCLALDTIERWRDGEPRYVITCIDLASRFSFALAFRSRSSAHAALTLRCAQIVFPLPLRRVLSDNGGEFARHFHDATVAQNLVHWHTAPRTPKMNAHCERFNRTIQQELVDYHEDLLFGDHDACNDRLFEWLHWYNAERPTTVSACARPWIYSPIISATSAGCIGPIQSRLAGSVLQCTLVATRLSRCGASDCFPFLTSLFWTKPASSAAARGCS